MFAPYRVNNRVNKVPISAAKTVVASRGTKEVVLTGNQKFVLRDTKNVAPQSDKKYSSKEFRFQGNTFTNIQETLQFIVVCCVILHKKPDIKEWMIDYMREPFMFLDALLQKKEINEVKALAFNFNSESITAKMVVDYLYARVKKFCCENPTKKIGIVIFQKKFELSPKFLEFYEEMTEPIFGNAKPLILLLDHYHHLENTNQLQVSCVNPSRNFLEGLTFEKYAANVENKTTISSSEIVVASTSDNKVADDSYFKTQITVCVAKLTQKFAIELLLQAEMALNFAIRMSQIQIYSEEFRCFLLETMQKVQNAYIVQDSAVLLDAVVQAGEFVPQLFVDEDEENNHVLAGSRMIQEALDLSVHTLVDALSPQTSKNLHYDANFQSSKLDAAIDVVDKTFDVVADFLKQIKKCRESLLSDKKTGGSTPSATQSVKDVLPPVFPNLMEFLDSSQAPLPDHSKKDHPTISMPQFFVPYTNPFVFAPNIGQKNLIQELPEMLANLEISNENTVNKFIVPIGTDIGGNNLVQKPDKLSENVPDFEPPPPLPIQSAPLGGDIGDEGAQSSGDPSKDQPEIVLTNVGVSRNPHTNKPPFQPQGEDGDTPPVQMLANPGNPPGNSGEADSPKPPLSNVLWSDSSQVRTDLSASLPSHPKEIGEKGKSVQKLPKIPSSPLGGDIGGSLQVKHSSGIPNGNPPESASTNLVLSLPSCPFGHDIGGTEPPPSAPSLSVKLGSVAPPHSPSFDSCPLGHDIGGRNPREQMLDIAMVLLLGGILYHHFRIPIVKDPHLSHIPLSHLAQAVEVA
jgi:hypothetical protein